MGNLILYFERDVELEDIKWVLEDYYKYDIVSMEGKANNLYGVVMNKHIFTLSNKGIETKYGSEEYMEFELVFEEIIPDEFSKLDCTLSEFALGIDTEEALELIEGPRAPLSRDLLDSGRVLRVVGDSRDFNCCAVRHEVFMSLYDMFGGLVIVDDSLHYMENLYYRR